MRFGSWNQTSQPAAIASQTIDARQSRVVNQCQASQISAGTNAHHISGVPISSTSREQLADAAARARCSGSSR